MKIIIGDSEREDLIAEAKRMTAITREQTELVNRLAVEFESPLLRPAAEAERAAREADQRRIREMSAELRALHNRRRPNVEPIYDEDAPNVFHVSRGRPTAKILKFPTATERRVRR